MTSKQSFISDGSVTITSLSWERIYLNMDVRFNAEQPPSLSLARIIFPRGALDGGDDDHGVITGTLHEEHAFTAETIDGNTIRYRLNLSIMNGRNFLANGRWYFLARPGAGAGSAAPSPDGTPTSLCTITEEAAYTLRDLDRIYDYGRTFFFYTVYFSSFCVDNVHIVPEMNSFFTSVNENWRDRYIIRFKKTLKGKFKLARKKFKFALIQAAYNVLERIHNKKGDHILFMSETRPYLWGNLKYIDARIKERGLDKDYHLDYSLRVAVGKNNSAGSWLKTIRLLARQDIIFVDDFVPIFSFQKLSPRTKLIQVWHAGEGFKSVGFSRFGTYYSQHPCQSCHKRYDYAITGSERLAEIYSEVFGIPRDRVLPLGMARLDGFLDEETVAAMRKDFYDRRPACAGKNLILFCPTFRGPNQAKAYYDYDELDLQQIYDFCGDEYIWAFKMHPFVSRRPEIPPEYAGRIIDLSDSENINNLYYVTDIMITDYSSAYYEFALLGRPILFFTYDRAVYEIVRGVHKKIKDTAPGKVCDTFDELMTALKTGDVELEKTLAFREANFGDYDGHAADRIIDRIITKPTPA